MVCSIGEEELLPIADNIAVFAHTLAGGKEDGSLLDVLYCHVGRQVAELVVYFVCPDRTDRAAIFATAAASIPIPPESKSIQLQQSIFPVLRERDK